MLGRSALARAEADSTKTTADAFLDIPGMPIKFKDQFFNYLSVFTKQSDFQGAADHFKKNGHVDMEAVEDAQRLITKRMGALQPIISETLEVQVLKDLFGPFHVSMRSRLVKRAAQAAQVEIANLTANLDSIPAGAKGG